ncbi:hypothetical protein [Larsenimonas salina]|uniref:hypothetical protein n=1 Tax=Larsenimonas salina TaxID=1295565 RepID=UPI002072D4F2|nr:hypothetical protein [Larsenimonas salina]MCM5703173.1 hypothetical protein [Larsenimonas salina]
MPNYRIDARSQSLVSRLTTLLANKGVTPTKLAITGFVVGLLAVPALWAGQLELAAVVLLIHRLIGALSHSLPRFGSTFSSAGKFIDMVSSGLTYALFGGAMVTWGLTVSSEAAMTLSIGVIALVLAARSFSKTSATIDTALKQAPHHRINRVSGVVGHVSLTSFLVALCLMPSHADLLSISGGSLCLVTAALYVALGFQSLRRAERKYAAPFTAVAPHRGSAHANVRTVSNGAAESASVSSPGKVASLTRKRAEKLEAESGVDREVRRQTPGQVVVFPSQR